MCDEHEKQIDCLNKQIYYLLDELGREELLSRTYHDELARVKGDLKYSLLMTSQLQTIVAAIHNDSLEKAANTALVLNGVSNIVKQHCDEANWTLDDEGAWCLSLDVKYNPYLYAKKVLTAVDIMCPVVLAATDIKN